MGRSRQVKVAMKDELVIRLQEAAERQMVSPSEIVRRALVNYLESENWASLGPRLGLTAAQVGPHYGPTEAQVRPSRRAPSLSPPRSPSALPLYPPSISPPKQQGLPSPGDGAPPTETLLEFRCIAGRRSQGTRWYLTQEQVQRWEETYPDLDVLGEAKRARDYLEAKGPRTSDGMPLFLVNWFNRGVNSGRYMRRSSSPQGNRGKRTLQEAFGYPTWEAWEAKLREHLTGLDLELELDRLRDIRGKWEAGNA